MANSNFTFDISQVNKRLSDFLKKHPAMVEKAMWDIAEALEVEAEKRAPIDEDFLAGSIRGEVQRDGGQIAAVIKVPNNSQASEYAVAMHEGEYELGPLSLGRQANTDVQVGKKYITRAIDENLKKVTNKLAKNLKVENYG